MVIFSTSYVTVTITVIINQSCTHDDNLGIISELATIIIIIIIIITEFLVCLLHEEHRCITES